MRIVIEGKPITKKNSQRIVLVGGKPRIIQSKQYIEYEKLALWQIKRPEAPIDYSVNVACVYYVPDRRKRDLLNLMGATMDILVRAGVITDDNSKVVVSHDGSRVLYDKEHPRVEITITEVDNDNTQNNTGNKTG